MRLILYQGAELAKDAFVGVQVARRGLLGAGGGVGRVGRKETDVGNEGGCGDREGMRPEGLSRPG